MSLEFPHRVPTSDAIRPISFIELVRTVISSIDEGLERAERYRALDQKSDAHLASLGLERQDLARLACFGRAA